MRVEREAGIRDERLVGIVGIRDTAFVRDQVGLAVERAGGIATNIAGTADHAFDTQRCVGRRELYDERERQLLDSIACREHAIVRAVARDAKFGTSAGDTDVGRAELLAVPRELCGRFECELGHVLDRDIERVSVPFQCVSSPLLPLSAATSVSGVPEAANLSWCAFWLPPPSMSIVSNARLPATTFCARKVSLPSGGCKLGDVGVHVEYADVHRGCRDARAMRGAIDRELRPLALHVEIAVQASARIGQPIGERSDRELDRCVGLHCRRRAH